MNIVALHSSQSHSGQWRALSKALALEPDFTLHTPDLVGYGRAPAFDQPAESFRFADELAALQQQLPADVAPGGEPVVLVGHSFGGAVALHWALRYPQQVQGLVLYEPVSFHVLPAGHAAREEIVSIAEKMDALSLEQAAACFVDYWNQPGYFSRLPEKARALMIAQQAKVNADFHALLDQPTQLAEYAAVTVPVVLIHGTQSPLSSQTVAQLLAATLPNCLHLDLDGGHMAPLTQSAQVNPLMLNGIRYICEQMQTTS
ncbi:MAG: alpha/beta hydrolase [Aliidiomarina sp.]|uniref:alpha/beta fold hydrolase n=1 Tax=Aliidiomarina sp. TaxID=1872439 RepID=UPI0025BDD165|nr:alpha/beta hydrolase [Aliidiomarina sp.]MCH8501487.1 alpha/beta hydrolase [Aliidiomarina sp.]